MRYKINLKKLLRIMWQRENIGRRINMENSLREFNINIKKMTNMGNQSKRAKVSFELQRDIITCTESTCTTKEINESKWTSQCCNDTAKWRTNNNFKYSQKGTASLKSVWQTANFSTTKVEFRRQRKISSKSWKKAKSLYLGLWNPQKHLSGDRVNKDLFRWTDTESFPTAGLSRRNC